MSKRILWSQDEYMAAIDAYVEMLKLETANIPYKKAEFRKELEAKFDRSGGAFEYRFQNISGAMQSLGMPIIRGYLPAHNYNNVLEDYIVDYFKNHTNVQVDILSTAEIPPEDAPKVVVPSFEEAPESEEQEEIVKQPRARKGVKRNYAEREESNRKLGKAGETYILRFEEERLKKAGCSGLASKIEWVADTQGDGLGYDISSFNEDGSSRLIEVKTTRGGKHQPFIITQSELEFSNSEEGYYLYRVYDFDREPKVYCLQGSLSVRSASKKINIRPISYQMSF